MRLAAATALAIAALAAACSINHRSGDFTCQTQADCSSNRVCVEGFCVLATLDGGTPGTANDAPSPGGDAAITGCPAQCSSCNLTQKTCAVNCTLVPALCKQAVTCPAGWSCDIVCAGDNACSSVDCTAGTSCTITCSGQASCQSVDCGASACNVVCQGRDSCRGIDCQSSCACDVNCQNATSCLPKPMCPPTCMSPDGCSSQSPACNTCL